MKDRDLYIRLKRKRKEELDMMLKERGEIVAVGDALFRMWSGEMAGKLTDSGSGLSSSEEQHQKTDDQLSTAARRTQLSAGSES